MQDTTPKSQATNQQIHAQKAALLREKTLEQVKSLFRSLIFISNEEVNSRLPLIEKLPYTALVKLKILFTRAHQKQMDFFRVLMADDHLFASKIISMLF